MNSTLKAIGSLRVRLDVNYLLGACLVWFCLASGRLVEHAAAQAPVRQNAVQIWILRGLSKEAYEQRLVTLGENSLSNVKQVLADGQEPLTSEQESKLKLALKGVVSRFQQDIVQLDALVGEINLNDQNEQRKAVQLLQPAMQRAQQGWYGKEMFEQVVENILTPPQREQVENQRLRKLEQQYRALTLRFVADLDGVLVLSKDQRERLVNLINEQKIPKLPENFLSYVAHLKVLRIPAKDLSFLDEKQREKLTATVEPYRMWERSIR